MSSLEALRSVKGIEMVGHACRLRIVTYITFSDVKAKLESILKSKRIFVM